MSEASDLRNEFQRAAQAPRASILSEFWGFLKTNKKWWLLPILLVLGLMTLLVFLSSTAAAPFISRLF